MTDIPAWLREEAKKIRTLMYAADEEGLYEPIPGGFKAGEKASGLLAAFALRVGERLAQESREPGRSRCRCAVPDPVMQADRRFYCYTCSLQVPAVLCDRCSTGIVEVAAQGRGTR